MTSRVLDYTPRLSDFIGVRWKLRPCEIAFIGLALIYIPLIRSTHLPFAWYIAGIFGMKMVQLIGVLYVLTLVVVGARAYCLGKKDGFSVLKRRHVWLSLLQPYWTLNYLFLSIRRCLVIFGSIFLFLHLKHVIYFIHPENFDLTYWNLDRRIHFGVQPNILFMELFGKDQEFAVLTDWLYIHYFQYKICVALFFLLEIRDHELSERFFLAYTLMWLLGGLSYLVAPADGPCYSVLWRSSVPNIEDRAQIAQFQFPITEDVPASYIEKYQNAKIWIAKIYQERLWVDRKEFLEGKKLPGVFYGVAAMPSLHVAALVMLAIFLWSASSVAGVVGIIYAIWIFIGSIFLQWHYAVDGYAGAALAALICAFSFRIRIGSGHLDDSTNSGGATC